MQSIDISLEEGRLRFEGRTFSIRVVESDRTTLGLSVYPDGSVVLRTSRGTPRMRIDRFLQRKERWLMKQLRFFGQYHPHTPERKFTPGETHLYKGKAYRLRLKQGPKWKRSTGKYYITVTTPHPERKDLIRQHYYTWLRQDAEQWLSDNFLLILGIVRDHTDIQTPSIALKHFKAKWGMYDPERNEITLNYLLIQAGQAEFEYVLLHELCHVKHMNHDKAFYSLLTRVCPDWKKRKERLEKMMA